MTRTEPAPPAAPGIGPAPAREIVAAAPPGREVTPRWVTWLGWAVVALCCVYVFWQQHPNLLLRNTTATGGDTGAHVWGPAYLRHHLLPQWRIAGWSPDFYAGFPAYQFYWTIPALIVVVFNLVVPYNIAFKLVTALGPVMLPVAAYAFARGIRLPRPAPVLCAVASVAFLFFRVDPGTTPAAQSIAFNQRIMGGTLTSNLAGEFSYTIALCFALFFLGALAVALERRRGLWLPALLLALAIMSHLVVGLFAVLGALIVWVCARHPWRRLPALAAVGLVGGLLTAVWTVPLVATLSYTTNMRYEKLTQYRTYLFPGYLSSIVYGLALVALVTAVVLGRRSTLILGVLTGAVGLWFCVWPEVHAWNLRFLPFWYLGLLLLAATGAAELMRGVGIGLRLLLDPPGDDDAPPDRTTAFVRRWGTVGVATVLAALMACAWLIRINGTATLDRWLPSALEGNSVGSRGYAPYWALWNYSGYEAKPSYPEYKQVIDTMGSLPPGRAAFEKVTGDNGGDVLNWYGSDFALYLLPYWTNGRISSMEGLYFEASATTPYHFIAMSRLARNPANSVRGLQYGTFDQFPFGVQELQALGVRYYMAQSAEAKARADVNPGLRLVAQVPDSDGLPPSGWKIYEVVGGDALVTPLAFQPVVLQGVDAADGWLNVSTAWFNDPDALARPLVASGPADWQRAPGSDARAAARVDLPPVTVSDIRSDDHSISFHVSQTGVPVLVKTSYFPNWRATGAKGPWRSTPNYMVVVPTSNDVRLVYEQTSAEWMGLGGSILGLVGLVALALFFGSASRRRRPSGDVPPSTSEPVVVAASSSSVAGAAPATTPVTAPATTPVTAPATDDDEPAPEPFDGPNRERTGPGLP